jgi:hypothetical protein
MRKMATGGTVLVVALLALGCGGGPPTMLPVKGQVMIEHKPAANVTVYFWPDASTKDNFATRHAMGQTDATGQFVLKCSRGGLEGIEAGDYHVTFSKPISAEGRPIVGFEKPEQSGTIESIPRPYNDHANPKNSPSTASVSSGSQEFVFDLPAK